MKKCTMGGDPIKKLYNFRIVYILVQLLRLVQSVWMSHGEPWLTLSPSPPPPQPAAPREAHFVSTKNNLPQLLEPIPYEFMA